MTTRPARKSLAAAFAAGPPMDRSRGLGDLLPRRSGNTDETTAVAPPSRADFRAVSGEQRAGEVDAAGGEQAAAEQAAQDLPVPASHGVSSAADVVRSVAVYLPVEILERLRMTARSREMTYADLLVEAAATHLDEVAGSFVVPVRTGTGMPARVGRRTPQPGVQVQLRLDGYQVAWLDEQAVRLGAPSRTALVVALLRQHLGDHG